MYFHDGIRDYILFKTAVPKSRGAHLFGCIPVCLATVFIHSLREYRGDVYSACLLWWLTAIQGLYALAVILVAAAAVLHEVLKWIHVRLDKHWKDVKRAGYAVRISCFLRTFSSMNSSSSISLFLRP